MKKTKRSQIGEFDIDNKKHASIYYAITRGLSLPEKAMFTYIIAKLLHVNEDSVFDFIMAENEYWEEMQKLYDKERKRVSKVCFDIYMLWKKVAPDKIKAVEDRYKKHIKTELFHTLSKVKTTKSVVELEKAEVLNKKLKTLEANQILVERARQVNIQDYLKTKKRLIRCPFHLDRTPSLDISKNFFYCYGCGAHGDIIKFVMDTEHLNFTQAIQRLAFH